MTPYHKKPKATCSLCGRPTTHTVVWDTSVASPIREPLCTFHASKVKDCTTEASVQRVQWSKYGRRNAS